MPDRSDGSPQAAHATVSLTELCALLSNDVRMGILKRLCEGPADVGELTRLLHRRQSQISQSLRQLRDANLVRMRQDKLRHVYQLSPAVRIARGGRETFIITIATDGGELFAAELRPRQKTAAADTDAAEIELDLSKLEIDRGEQDKCR